MFFEKKARGLRNRTTYDSENLIRVSYVSKRNSTNGSICNLYLYIYLGRDVADKLKITENDRIRFFIDCDNHHNWYMEKSTEDFDGYKVNKPTHFTGIPKHYVIQMKWDLYVPEKKFKKVHEVKFEIKGNKIEICDS